MAWAASEAEEQKRWGPRGSNHVRLCKDSDFAGF